MENSRLTEHTRLGHPIRQEHICHAFSEFSGKLTIFKKKIIGLPPYKMPYIVFPGHSHNKVKILEVMKCAKQISGNFLASAHCSSPCQWRKTQPRPCLWPSPFVMVPWMKKENWKLGEKWTFSRNTSNLHFCRILGVHFTLAFPKNSLLCAVQSHQSANFF